MKLSNVFILALSFAFFACSDDESSTSPESDKKTSEIEKESDSKKDYDCSVENGVKVVFPTSKDTFKMGDSITVIYGSDIAGSGYRFIFKENEEDYGLDMGKGSLGPENPDGKTCYKETFVLNDEFAIATNKAIIRVEPYERQNKGSNSETFKVID